ncbi:MAG: MFS transporter [Acidimicrobiales bacterium]
MADPLKNQEYEVISRSIGQSRALLLIAAAEVLTLSVWFSASVVSSPLQRLWHLTPIEVALLTASVQLGFVVGAVAASLTALADRFDARRVLALSALLAAGVNALFTVSSSWEMGMVLRMLTGVAMVGVYPVAVKLVAEWSPRHRGSAVGILVGALTVGSALPHLILFFGISAPWQSVVLASSALALLGAGIVTFFLPAHPQQRASKSGKISLASLRAVVTNRAVMLTNYGYFGHMWELYAMWTWFPTFVYASFVLSGHRQAGAALAALSSFLIIGMAGAAGSVLGGRLADRFGRTVITSVAMGTSGLCALVVGFTFGGPIWIVLLVGTIWGIAVVADSAQFSAAVTELSAVENVGTALTMQTAVGFVITILSINLVAAARDVLGWHWVFVLLSAGPFLGVYSMLRLRAHASSFAMAGGQR